MFSYNGLSATHINTLATGIKTTKNRQRFMNTETLLHIFLQGSGLLVTDSDDAICVGEMLPVDSEKGLERIMIYHTQIIDKLVEFSKSSVQTIQLLSMRGLAFHEYRTVLFDTSIHYKDFGKYPALRCLFFSSDKERRERIFYQYDRNSHADYEVLLAQMLQPFHPQFFQFLFVDENQG